MPQVLHTYYNLTVVEFLMLEIQPTFFYKISPGLPFSMYIIMVGRKNAYLSAHQKNWDLRFIILSIVT